MSVARTPGSLRLKDDAAYIIMVRALKDILRAENDPYEIARITLAKVLK